MLSEEVQAKMSTDDLKEFIATMLEVIGDTYHGGNWLGLSHVCFDVAFAAREITMRSLENDVKRIHDEVHHEE